MGDAPERGVHAEREIFSHLFRGTFQQANFIKRYFIHEIDRGFDVLWVAFIIDELMHLLRCADIL